MTNHLIVGVTVHQLIEYSKTFLRNSPAAILYRSDLRIVVYDDVYHLVVGERNDHRVMGMEYASVEYLPGVMWTLKPQYEARRRP